MEEHNTKLQEQNECSKAFKWFHATSLNGGPQLIAATINSYFAIFLTDQVGIPAGIASTILLIASAWDAINDPIMGTIADRTQTKYGRYRPYFRVFPVLLAIVGVLLFLNPQGLSQTGKTVYIAVFYVLYGMVFTVLTMPQMAVLPACTKSDRERNSIIALGGAVTAIAYVIASSFTTNFLQWTGGSYVPLMVVYGLLTIVCFWGLFATTKEKYLKPFTKGTSVFVDLKKLFRHGEIYPVMLAWCLVAVGYALMFSSSVYYVMYYLTRPDLITTYMLIISMGALISMMVLLPIALRIFKTGHKALMYTQAIAAVLYCVAFFVGGKSLIVLYVISFLATCSSAMSMALVNVLLNDTIDFVQLKDGISLNGTISALRGFAGKLGQTIASSGILAVLAATGYVAGAIGQQPDSALFGINLVRFGVPAAVSLILALLLKFYPIEKHYPAIAKMKEAMKANEE